MVPDACVYRAAYIYITIVKIPNLIKKVEAARAKLAALEKAASADKTKVLVALPAKLGYADVKSLIAALQAVEGPQHKGPVSKADTAKVPTKGMKRRTRAVVTEATRAEVKKLVELGKTGGEIAKTVGVSLPTVQNIKKALGLIRKR